MNESTCTLQELAGNVQNAGYSVLIYFGSDAIATVKNSKNKVLISVASASKEHQIPGLSDADGTYVDIAVKPFDTDELMKMESYLKRLYLWFLIGPFITLDWMRRTGKFCWMTDGPNDQVSEERATENVERNAVENEIRITEEGENGTEESHQLSPLNNQGSSVIQISCEEQPLLVEYTRQPRRIGRVKSLKEFFYKGVLCFSYVTLIIAALPMGMSRGGLSFFRFDHRETSLEGRFLLAQYRSRIQQPRLRVVPHFSSGIVEERNTSVRKNHPTRKMATRGESACRVSPFLAWGDFHARSCFAPLLSLRKNGGLLVVYQQPSYSYTLQLFNAFVVVNFSDTLFFAVQSGCLQFLLGYSYQLFKTY